MRLRATRLTAVAHAARVASAAAWFPLSWFASSEQGLWYDPTDLTRYMSVAVSPELVAPINLQSGWSSSGAAVTFDSATAFTAAGVANVFRAYVEIGKTYLLSVNISNTAGAVNLYNGTSAINQIGTTLSSGVTQTFSFTALATQINIRPTAAATVTVNSISVKEVADIATATMYQDSAGTTPVTAVEQPVGRILDKSGRGNHATQATSTARPTLRNRYNLLLNSATLSTQNVTTVATGYQLRFSGAGSITLSGTATGTYNAGTHSITCTAGTLTLTVSGSVTSADLLYSTDSARPYQSITTATSYDSDASKFPLYLAFDGSDDSLATGSVDFSGTNKITAVIGATKLSDASTATFFELTTNSGTTPGGFGLFTNVNGYRARSGGSVLIDAAAGSVPSPATRVSTVVGDIAGDVLTLRNNGAVAVTNTADQGAGNYANAVLYIGRRASASLPLSGRIYQLIIRGAASADIADAESFVASKSGVVL